MRDATIHPKATENIQQIIDLVQTLIDKGYAYAVNGDVYYRTKSLSITGNSPTSPLRSSRRGPALM